MMKGQKLLSFVCVHVYYKKKKEPYGNNLFVLVLFPALIYTYEDNFQTLS